MYVLVQFIYLPIYIYTHSDDTYFQCIERGHKDTGARGGDE